MSGEDPSTELDPIRKVWIILNAVLVFYALILFFYGKFIKQKDSLSYVNHIIYNI